MRTESRNPRKCYHIRIEKRNGTWIQSRRVKCFNVLLTLLGTFRYGSGFDATCEPLLWILLGDGKESHEDLRRRAITARRSGFSRRAKLSRTNKRCLQKVLKEPLRGETGKGTKRVGEEAREGEELMTVPDENTEKELEHEGQVWTPS